MNLRELDTALFLYVNRALNISALDGVMVFITDWNVLIYTLMFGLLYRKEKEKALTILLICLAAVALGDWSGYMLKKLIARPRPCSVLEDIILLVGCGPNRSMPSNHAVNAFAVAVPFYFLTKSRLRHAMLGISVLVAYSRPYVGVHYVSDMLLGSALGTLVAIGTVHFYRRAEKRALHWPYTTYLGVFLFAITLFRIYYITRGVIDLSPDEAHYWEWTRRPELSYYSKGPLIAWLITAGTAIFGDNAFGVRAPAVILSVLSSVLIFKLAKKLFDERTGAYAAALFQVIPLFSTYGIVNTIDAPYTFLWILSLYLLHAALQTGRTRDWVFLGIGVGAGVLAKYTMGLFFVCVLFYLLLHKTHRSLLLTAKPYIGFAVSLITLSPILIWNAMNGWVTFRHTAKHVNVEDGLTLNLNSMAEFIGSQMGVVTPVLVVMIVIALLKMRRTESGAFLAWFSLPVLAFFVLKSAQGKVQANWAMAGYLSGLIAFSAYYLRDIRSAPRLRRIAVGIALALCLGFVSITHYPQIVNLPPKYDPSARLRGWKELGQKVSLQLGLIKKPFFIFSDRYQIASELAFYVEGQPVTYNINLGRRMNQYDLWPGIDERLIHYNALFVRIGDAQLPAPVEQAFASCEKDIIKISKRRRSRYREFTVFRCSDFTGSIKQKAPAKY